MKEHRVILPEGFDASEMELVHPIFHTERNECLSWVIADIEILVLPSYDERLLPGWVRHLKTGGAYFLKTTAFDDRAFEHGVCYRSEKPAADGRGPYFFRPLRTSDGKGWLDLVNGKPRFERLTFEASTMQMVG